MSDAKKALQKERMDKFMNRISVVLDALRRRDYETASIALEKARAVNKEMEAGSSAARAGRS